MQSTPPVTELRRTIKTSLQRDPRPPAGSRTLADTRRPDNPVVRIALESLRRKMGESKAPSHCPHEWCLGIGPAAPIYRTLRRDPMKNRSSKHLLLAAFFILLAFLLFLR